MSDRPSTGTIGITGGTGYVGRTLVDHFAAQGWRPVVFSSRPGRPEATETREFDLCRPPTRDVFEGIDVLVHCGYVPTRESKAPVDRDVNVVGTERLLRSAREAGVQRVVVVSSVAAFPGTKQHYGMVKLAIEHVAAAYSAATVRPGLIYGPTPGGIVGGLDRVVRAVPVVPVFGAGVTQYVVHVSDLAAGIQRVVESDAQGPITIAAPDAVAFGDFLEVMAARHGKRPRFVPVPWRPVYLAMRSVERLGATLPFRADSLWGLCHPVPPPDFGPAADLGISIRPFGSY